MELNFHAQDIEKDSKKSEKDDEKELEKSPDKRFIKYDKEVQWRPCYLAETGRPQRP